MAAAALVAVGVMVSCGPPDEYDGITHFTDALVLALVVAVVGAAIWAWKRSRKK